MCQYKGIGFPIKVETQGIKNRYIQGFTKNYEENHGFLREDDELKLATGRPAVFSLLS